MPCLPAASPGSHRNSTWTNKRCATILVHIIIKTVRSSSFTWSLGQTVGSCIWKTRLYWSALDKFWQKTGRQARIDRSQPCRQSNGLRQCRAAVSTIGWWETAVARCLKQPPCSFFTRLDAVGAPNDVKTRSYCFCHFVRQPQQAYWDKKVWHVLLHRQDCLKMYIDCKINLH